MLRAVLFDFNGVLVDDEPIHTQTLDRVLLEEGIPWNRALYEERFVGVPDRGVLEWALNESGHAPEEPYLMRLLARKRAYYQETIDREGYPWFSGAIELIRNLADEGLPMGIVSGAQKNEILRALDRAGVSDSLRTIVGSDDVENGKPDPEGYIQGLTALNTTPPLPERLLHPHEVLAVEDSQVGLQAAQDAGLSTLAVTSSFPADKLRSSDRIVEEIGSLSSTELLLR